MGSEYPDEWYCLNSSAVSGYIAAARDLACELLDLIGEGLWVPDTSVFSRLIRGVDSDSVFRLNHYPHLHNKQDFCEDKDTSSSSFSSDISKVGFGEHSDPQILTLLRSNDVGGLQISPQDGVWVPVPSDPTALWVNVGDVLQVGLFSLSRFSLSRYSCVMVITILKKKTLNCT